MDQYLKPMHTAQQPLLPTTVIGPKRTPKTFKTDDVIDLTESPPASLSERSPMQPAVRETSPVDMFAHAKRRKSLLPVQTNVDVSQSLLDDDDDDLMDALDQLEESTDSLGAVLKPKTSHNRKTTSSDSILILSGESVQAAATPTTQLLDALFKHVPEERDNALW